MERKFMIFILLFDLCFLLSGCQVVKESDNLEWIPVGDRILISTEKVEKILATTRITVEDSRNNNMIKQISEKEEIEKILKIISQSTEEKGIVTTESSNWCLSMYDLDNMLISKIWVWKSGHLGFTNEKEYSFSNIRILKSIIE